MMSTSEHFTKLVILWEELEHYRPPFNCLCPVKCSYTASRNAILFREHDYFLRFLHGLNDEYASVRSLILIIDLVLALTKVCSMVKQHEHQNRLGFVEDSVAMVNAAKYRKGIGWGWGARPPSSGRGKICTFYRKTKHTIYGHGLSQAPPGSRP